MTLTHWHTAPDIAGLDIERLSRMVDSVFTGDASATREWVPALDVFETADHALVVKVDLPAVKREDIKVTFEQGVLAIEGERKLDTEIARDQYHRVERVHGTFRRSLKLPATADAAKVEAAFEHGVLTVKVPQRPDAKPRQIAIN